MKLYKISLETVDVWAKLKYKKIKPIYVVSASKDSARVYAAKHLREGLKIKNVSVLGEQLGAWLYSGNDIT